MSNDLPVHTVELNGAPATADDLRHLIQTNYGHFSAMRVEDGGVRGLDLHLARIEAATLELFGKPVDRDRVRACLRHATGGRQGALSLRVNIFSRALSRERTTASPRGRPSSTHRAAKSCSTRAPRARASTW